MAFKIGDVVYLKSGSPLMTVTGFGNDGSGNQHVNCVWFDKGQQEKHGSFPPEALEADTGPIGPVVA